jgi:hypothetical protein
MNLKLPRQRCSLERFFKVEEHISFRNALGYSQSCKVVTRGRRIGSRHDANRWKAGNLALSNKFVEIFAHSIVKSEALSKIPPESFVRFSWTKISPGTNSA